MKIIFNNCTFNGLPTKPTKPVIKSVHKINPIINTNGSQKGAFREYAMSLITKIGELFELAHSSINNTSKSLRTKSKIKNGYQNIKTGVAGSRILEFEKIGPNGENISINYRIDHKKKKAIIIIDDKQFVINPKGQIEKNPSMKFIRDLNPRDKGEVIQYYTQEEIDNSKLEYYLKILEQKLDEVNSNLQHGINERKMKAKHKKAS